MISTGSCFSNIQGSPPFEGVGAKAMWYTVSEISVMINIDFLKITS